jgi:hypothetical protein
MYTARLIQIHLSCKNLGETNWHHSYRRLGLCELHSKKGRRILFWRENLKKAGKYEFESTLL